MEEEVRAQRRWRNEKRMRKKKKRKIKRKPFLPPRGKKGNKEKIKKGMGVGGGKIRLAGRIPPRVAPTCRARRPTTTPRSANCNKSSFHPGRRRDNLCGACFDSLLPSHPLRNLVPSSLLKVFNLFDVHREKQAIEYQNMFQTMKKFFFKFIYHLF